MHYWIENQLNLVQFAPYLFLVSIVLFLLLGWLYGRYRLRKSPNIIVRDSLASAIFGLSALVLGFTFSNANDHFDQRMSLLREQAASIEQVYDSTRYLNSSDQVSAQKALKTLLSLRLAAYEGAHSFNDLDDHLDQLSKQLNIVNEVITLAIQRSPPATKELADKILRPQLSHLMDVSQSGIQNAKHHPPAILERFLFILLSIGSLLSGYAMAAQQQEDWFLTGLYLFLMSFALVVIFSLEFPNQLFEFQTINSDFLRLKKELH